MYQKKTKRNKIKEEFLHIRCQYFVILITLSVSFQRSMLMFKNQSLLSQMIESPILYDKVALAFIWQRYFFPCAKHKRECRKCHAEKKKNSPVRSYLVLARKLVDRLSRDQSREEGWENRRDELVGSAARPVQLTIKKSPRTLIHGEARRREEEKQEERERTSGASDKSTNQSRRWSPPSYSLLSEAPLRLYSLDGGEYRVPLRSFVASSC